MGFKLDECDTLNCKTTFGCQSDCVDLKNDTAVKPVPWINKPNDLSIQGSFFMLQNINWKCSNSFLFICNINDNLYIFVVKARLGLFPTNFTLYLWDRQNNSCCLFGCFHTESLALVLNVCIHHFRNFYSRRQESVMEIIASFLKESIWYHIHIDKHISTMFPSLADKLGILVPKTQT